jgi:hypothetical protein
MTLRRKPQQGRCLIQINAALRRCGIIAMQLACQHEC